MGELTADSWSLSPSKCPEPKDTFHSQDYPVSITSKCRGMKVSCPSSRQLLRAIPALESFLFGIVWGSYYIIMTTSRLDIPPAPSCFHYFAQLLIAKHFQINFLNANRHLSICFPVKPTCNGWCQEHSRKTDSKMEFGNWVDLFCLLL